MTADIRAAAVQAREALSNIIDYVRNKDDLYANGAIRQFAEEGADVLDLALAAPAPQPSGWRLVPVEPTMAMSTAFSSARPQTAVEEQDGSWSANAWDCFRASYAAMLAASPAPQDGPPLSSINELAKVYASSYASPHHITFTVEGLRNLIGAMAGTKQDGSGDAQAPMPMTVREVEALARKVGVFDPVTFDAMTRLVNAAIDAAIQQEPKHD